MPRLPRFNGIFGLVLTFGVASTGASLAWAQADPAPATPAPADPAAPATPAPADPAAPATPAPAAPGAAAAPTDPAAPPTTAPSGDATGAEAKVDQTVKQNIENFFHYVNVANYTLAAAEARQLVGRDFTPDVLDLMVAQAKQRHGDLDVLLLKWQQIPQLKDSTTQIIDKLNKVRGSIAEQPGFIEDNIKKLSGGGRAPGNALARLRQSGELAVPVMIDYLRDTNQSQYHSGIRWALGELGRGVLNPLVAATESRDPSVLLVVSDTLAASGNPDVVPYLARVLEDPSLSPPARNQITAALRRMGADPKAKAGDEFYALATRFYYGSATIAADPRRPGAAVWFWDNAKGLTHKDVPHGIFNDVMAMRTAEAALRLGAHDDTAGLWLAADNKRETNLKDGQTDPVFGGDAAHFWNVRLGAQFSNNVLARALHDGNTPVAMKVIKSLQEITGDANMFAAGDSPLLTAIQYPNRLVRYEAAIAVAGGLPQKAFPGQSYVVSTLAEAVAQTGTSSVLILAPNDKEKLDLQNQLKAFHTAGAANAAGTLAEANGLPSVDVVLLSDEVKADEIQALWQGLSQNPRTRWAAKLVITKNPQSPWFRAALADPLLSVSSAATPEALAKAVGDARQKASGTPVDEKLAGDYSLRAATLLERLRRAAAC